MSTILQAEIFYVDFLHLLIHINPNINSKISNCYGQNLPHRTPNNRRCHDRNWRKSFHVAASINRRRIYSDCSFISLKI